MTLPAISVIIPLYNCERYVGECLDSILAQTFQNFEVIVVDDCSTDNSVAVVKNYAPKFAGRLKLTRTKKNSGSPGEPGNVGLKLSRGEYIFVMDDDDIVTTTALAELYAVAKNFDADVVACEKYYTIPAELWHDEATWKKLTSLTINGDLVSRPTLLPEDILERFKACRGNKFLTPFPLWTKLIRRKFLTENKIQFANNLFQDVLTTYCLIYCAKRYVRVPNVINFYRNTKGSLSHPEEDAPKRFRRHVRSLIDGFKYLDDFLNGREFFAQHPDLKYMVFEDFLNEVSQYIKNIYNLVPAHELEWILRKEFRDGDNSALTAFTFSMMNLYQIKYAESLQRIAELEKSERENKAYIAELEKLATQFLRKE